MTDTFKKAIESLVKLKLLMNHCYTCSHYAFQIKDVKQWNVPVKCILMYFLHYLFALPNTW